MTEPAKKSYLWIRLGRRYHAFDSFPPEGVELLRGGFCGQAKGVSMISASVFADADTMGASKGCGHCLRVIEQRKATVQRARAKARAKAGLPPVTTHVSGVPPWHKRDEGGLSGIEKREVWDKIVDRVHGANTISAWAFDALADDLDRLGFEIRRKPRG